MGHRTGGVQREQKTLRQSGMLAVWNDEKGYGFIAPDLGGDQIFVHISGFKERWLRPAQFQRVDYMLASDPRGRPCAKNVSRPGVESPADGYRRVDYALYGIACSFFIVVGGLWAGGRIANVDSRVLSGSQSPSVRGVLEGQVRGPGGALADAGE